MTAAYRIIPNPVYTNLHFYPNMATSNPTHSHKTILCTYICSNIQIQSIFLHNILTNSTCTMSGQTLLCSNVLRTCTWKIVFKIEKNELNELSECMFYKMFFFSGKHFKTVKLTFTIIFQKPCLLCFTFL